MLPFSHLCKNLLFNFVVVVVVLVKLQGTCAKYCTTRMTRTTSIFIFFIIATERRECLLALPQQTH